ncbi:histidine kinase [Actinocorallia sp. API 0066]|uniref:sensor histidine kinase n=1 Tax=Actinocorallia sp. API 0066 TaxID=2896846 RepID=UPI001E4F5F32|nr:histidine kinase [Actinocorallia sp. API 0066]MCD0449423.1 histidine kinase [Actinocorallia sp. API 0066]
MSGRIRDLAGAVWEDLSPRGVSPLAPIGLSRFPLSGWLPHLLVVCAAAVLGGSSWHILLTDYGIADPTAAVLGLTHASAMVLALWRPIAAWWLSLGMVAITGLAADSVAPQGDGPLLAAPSLSVHLCVIALVGLRVRPRVALEMWVLTVAVTAGLLLVAPERKQFPNLPEVALLSGAVLVATVAVRARGEALRRLSEQRRLRVAELSRHALLEERTRIARELHDVVAHHMSVVAIQAEAATYRVVEMPDELAKSFATIRGHALEALTELHRVLGLLRQSDDGTDQAPQPTLAQLPELVEGVRQAGLDVDLVIEGEHRATGAGVELSAYRIVQESLSNVLRHAPGAEVEVGIGYSARGLTITVANGPAREPVSAAPGGGHGLLGMRERAVMLAGEFSARPRADGGFTVRAVLPYLESQ